MRGKGLVVALGLIVLALPAMAEVILEYGYKPGLTYRTNLTTTSEIDASSDDPQVAPMLHAMKDLVQTMTMIYDQTFHSPDPEGNLPFETVLTDVEITTTAGGQSMPVPPGAYDSLKGMKMTGAMSPTGQMTGTSIEAAGQAPGVTAESLTEPLNALTAVLPDHGLAPGDTFQSTGTVALPAHLGAGEAPTGTQTFTYTLRTISEQEALFDLASTLTLTGTGDEGTLSVSGSGTGTATFDRAGGFFREMVLKQHMVLSLTQPMALTMEVHTVLEAATTITGD
jgi:hypothetical protein